MERTPADVSIKQQLWQASVVPVFIVYPAALRIFIYDGSFYVGLYK